jgi:hypothetical protein
LKRTLDELKQDISDDYAALAAHPVFSSLKTLPDLRRFMELHVFAVWDFMSLLKRLQRDFTTFELPWLPPKNCVVARLVNDIVLGEESDDAPDGTHMSHYDLYVGAMREIGADTTKIETFLASLRSGMAFDRALDAAAAPPVVSRFVTATLKTALHGKSHEVLGSFFYGRENVIPAMFTALLDGWKIDHRTAPMFVFYLNRHIQLDSERHGPAAEAIIEELYGDDEKKLTELHRAAQSAVHQRRIFWDGVETAIHARD